MDRETGTGDLKDGLKDCLSARNRRDTGYGDCHTYSHCDPDHTMGIRVIEQLKMDWLAVSAGEKRHNPIGVATLPAILEDLRKQGTKYGSVLGYYETRGLVYTRGICSLKEQYTG